MYSVCPKESAHVVQASGQSGVWLLTYLLTCIPLFIHCWGQFKSSMI